LRLLSRRRFSRMVVGCQATTKQTRKLKVS
jgi:hypothetical protein